MDVKYTSINKEVRVRFAPSPTGDLHIGGLRTALYNYLFAVKNQGKFILRIEDTDKTREVEGSVQKIINSLKWAGLEYHEGCGSMHERVMKEIEPDNVTEGPHHPYKQSARLATYSKFCDTLLENKDAYHCFCSTDRLKQMRIQQGGSKHS